MAAPFADAHIHFWDHTVEGLRWRFLEPDFEHPRLGGLKHLDAPRYAVAELRVDQADCPAGKVVHVQAAQSEDPVLETAWLQALGDREGWPNAIVAHCDLSRPDAAEVVGRHAIHARFRGIRDLPAGERLDHPEVIRGFGLVASSGTLIEIMTSWEHYDKLLALAQRWPTTTIVLGHAGLPTSRSDDYFTAWSSGLRRLAGGAPNVVCKISALASGADPNWTIGSIRPWVMGCIEAFGPDRCMFASNWPVDKLFGSYRDLMNAYREIVDDLSPAEVAQLFTATTERVYRI
jgi:predicted TIM-barrel fold metal-dependent hydrolase